MLIAFEFSFLFNFKESKVEPNCSTTWTLSLEASPLEDSFSVNAPPSLLSGLRGLEISSFSPFGVLGSFLAEPNSLPPLACPTSWPHELPLKQLSLF